MKPVVLYPIDKKFDEIILNEQLVLLVGAGCSLDPPSNLPAGKQMMNQIIKFGCDEEFFEILKKKIDSLEIRFELLVELFQKHIDYEKGLIEYYGSCESPNLQHFYIANKIQEGAIVLTTNFDNCIEHALKKSGVQDIIPVITKKDFSQYSDPYALITQKKFPVYKIHGSHSNVITKENTSSSLITTVGDFGKNKEYIALTDLEPFKKPLLERISSNTTLIVIGYSGSDDFDIIPTLKKMRDLKTIIWFIHYGSTNNPFVYEILDPVERSDEKAIEIISQIKKINPQLKAYVIHSNVSSFISDIFAENIELNENFNISVMEWLEKKIGKVNPHDKLIFTYKILKELSLYEQALHCAHKIHDLAVSNNDDIWRALSFIFMGRMEAKLGHLDISKEALKRALSVAKVDRDLRVEIYSDLAETVTDPQEAVDYLTESLKLLENSSDIKKRSLVLGQLGVIYCKQKKWLEAIEKFEEAIEGLEVINDFRNISALRTNIGSAYIEQGDFNRGIITMREALELARILDNKDQIISHLLALGKVFIEIGKYTESYDLLEDALKISQEINNPKLIHTSAYSLAHAYESGKDYDRALYYYNIASKVQFILNDRESIRDIFEGICRCYYKLKLYDLALEYNQMALKINIENNWKEDIGIEKWWEGLILKKMNKKRKSKRVLYEAKEIFEELDLWKNVEKIMEELNKMGKKDLFN